MWIDIYCWLETCIERERNFKWGLGGYSCSVYCPLSSGGLNFARIIKKIISHIHRALDPIVIIHMGVNSIEAC